jgi:lipoate-protein ligase A
MLIINRPQTDPYFNIAAEEYLLKEINEDCFMIWQNEPSVVIGKHQNALAEINYHFLRKRNIPVIRRISGGGTVFHDPGNLNFSSIKTGVREKLIDFKGFLEPIIEVLQNLGIHAKFERKNYISVIKMKVSGNAAHVFQNKVLHHGTLLFSSDLIDLNEAIKIKNNGYKDKSVKSIRSQVTNISELLDPPLSIDEFREIITDHIKRNNQNVRIYNLTPLDVKAINNLVETKYKTWQWNFGYSPRYSYENKITLNHIEYFLKVEVKEGIIAHANLNFTGIRPGFNILIQNLLIGIKHNYNDAEKQIFKYHTELKTFNFEPNFLLELLF